MERILNYYIIQNRITITDLERNVILDKAYPFRIVNQKNKVVDYCKHIQDAQLKIAKRNEVAIMFGFEPQEYKIKKIIKKKITP